MDIAQHKNEFDRVIDKYGLSDDDKAEKISNYITKHPEGKIIVEEFSKVFGMDENDAMIFLSFIYKGIKYKEENIDNKSNA